MYLYTTTDHRATENCTIVRPAVAVYTSPAPKRPESIRHHHPDGRKIVGPAVVVYKYPPLIRGASAHLRPRTCGMNRGWIGFSAGPSRTRWSWTSCGTSFSRSRCLALHVTSEREAGNGRTVCGAGRLRVGRRLAGGEDQRAHVATSSRGWEIN